MKSKLLPALIAAIGLGAVAAPAQAGVIATTYLKVDNFVLLEKVGGNVGPITSGIAVTDDNRNGSLQVSLNGANQADSATSPAGSTAQTVDVAQLVIGSGNPYGQNDVTTVLAQNLGNFASADMLLSGTAFGPGASGLTRASASTSPGNVAAANAEITNNVFASIDFSVSCAPAQSTAGCTRNLGFGLDYVALALASITNDLLGTASSADASTNFSITVRGRGANAGTINGSTATTTIATLAFAANAIGKPGFEFDSTSDSVVGFLTNFYDYTDGDYSLLITTKSAVNVTALPEPSSIALAGLGLLGIGASLRRRKQA